MTDARLGKLLNVLDALQSSSELFTFKLWKIKTSLLFAGFLGIVSAHVGKPLTVILDNASVHKAKAIQQYLKRLVRMGTHAIFSPSLSPDMIRIEML